MVTSYNGWKASQNPADIGIAPLVVNGVSFPSGARGGDVGVVFGYLAEQYAKRVEPLVTPGCWGYYYKQSANSAALLSCHSSGTAIDLNAPKHPNGKRGTFTAAQVKAIRAILAELGGVVYWGGDAWGNGTPDEMHFEIDTNATVAQVTAVANKIRGIAAPTKEDDMPLTLDDFKLLFYGTPFRDQENLASFLHRLDDTQRVLADRQVGYGNRIEHTEAVVVALQGAFAGLAASGATNLTAAQIEAAVAKALKENVVKVDVDVAGGTSST